jgi:phosphoribosylanthranilate isomerase
VTWVKVCGLTDHDDVAAAVAAGADAVGFVLAAGSPRRVTVEQAADLGRGVAALRVLVTVDMAAAELLDAVRRTGADGVQPQGAGAVEAAALARRAGVFVLRPVRVAGPVDLAGVPAGQVPLLDTLVDGADGGTGETFDWALALGIERRFVLAGGLGPDNVARAVRLVRPWGVDASSRLEAAPGVKDHGRVAAFVEEAKNA